MFPTYASSGPASDPALPVLFDTFLPPATNLTIDSDAPAFSQWTRTAGPDESIVLNGYQFSDFTGADAGKDTRFVVFGQTSADDATLLDASIQQLDSLTAIVTLGATLPQDSMYLVWAVNAEGASRPVAINKAEAWWVGPDAATAGQTISVFGRNLAHNDTNTNAWVYIEPASGGEGQWAEVTGVNPYKVDFIVPEGLAAGEYMVYAHNGHGGELGWSDPVTLTVKAAQVWNGPVFNVRDFGAKGDGKADDTAAVQAAFAAARMTAGATIYMPAGTYNVKSWLWLIGSYGRAARLLGDGSERTTIRASDGFSGSVLLNASGMDAEVSGVTLDAGAANIPYLATFRGATGLEIKDVVFNARLKNYIDLHTARRVSINDSMFIGAGSFLGDVKQLFINGSTFYGTNDANALLYSWGGDQISITNCLAQDYDNSDASSGNGWAQGRFYVGSGIWGSQSNVYLGGNSTVDLGVRPGHWNQNSGEQILWEGNYTYWSGSPVSASGNKIRISGLGSSAPGDRITVVGGKGLGQSREIVGYDAATGTITLDRAWDLAPDASSKVVIGLVSERIAVYDNRLDGKASQVTQESHTASAGVEFYGGGIDAIVDSNTIRDVRRGIMSIAPLEEWALPVFSNLYTNNRFENTRESILMAGAAPAGQSSFVGNVFRRNTMAASTTAIYLSGVNGHAKALAGNIVEHNKVTAAQTGLLHQMTSTSLIRGNSFARGAAAVSGSMGVKGEMLGAAQVDNTWSGFASQFVLSTSQGLLEAPQRSLSIAAPAGTVQSLALPVLNVGTLSNVVAVTSSAGWLKTASGSLSVAAGEQGTLALTADTRNLAAGAHTATLRLTSGGRTRVVTVELIVGNIAASNPTVGALSSSRALVTAGEGFTLTASNASDADGSVRSMEFYLDTDHNGAFNAAIDTLIGIDTVASDGWSLTAGSAGLPSGVRTFFARARDNDGLTSAAVSTAFEVNQPPAIGSLSVYRGKSRLVRLTANNVVDADGPVNVVGFFMDRNNNGRIDGPDKLLGFDGNRADGWSLTGSDLSFGRSGTHYLAQAIDQRGAMSPARSSSAKLAAAVAGVNSSRTSSVSSLLSNGSTLGSLLEAWARGQAKLSGVTL